MFIRLSVACLLLLTLSASSHAFLARRFIEHRLESNALSIIACKADAARLCPGVTDDGSQFQCLKLHSNSVSFTCSRELKKLERQMGQ